VSIDADLVRADTELSHNNQTLGDMSNGCICYTLRDDLLAEMRRLSTEGCFNYLPIGSTAPTGSPIMLRGTLWPQQPNKSVLHHSPPIEGTGETRLVLVLDPIFDPGETDINFSPS
jgi:G3E family GTPase